MTHAERYCNLLALTKRPVVDSSYHAAFYLLATDDTLYKRACPHVSLDGVDFTAMKRKCGDLDYMQKQLLSIAHNLFSWTSKCPVTPHDLSCLGYPTLDYVCSAFYIANGMVRLQVQENDIGEQIFSLDMSRYEQNKKVYTLMFGPSGSIRELEPDGLEQG
ncbi:hypothetical protein [Desulfosporosinus lacus]|uniref:Uncharacterized protein n=1 Tax=Desulfosporosinus lacus DSM 15449 TaxID=1121420 RepID=A0A1M5V085_9FIRM|nr:hypothetical protein [Desulfosporosinus lacus]SHH68717.1 hypothetical protein SAMN02746098_01146 [Desulfosporosinus lacus DSM 15449]